MDRDIELNVLTLKEDSVAQGSIYNMREPVYHDGTAGRRSSAVTRFVDSFRRDPHSRITPEAVSSARGDSGEGEGGGGAFHTREHNGGHYFDLHSANLATANSGLSRELKGRHLQMIAIGGSIGERLFFLCCGW